MDDVQERREFQKSESELKTPILDQFGTDLTHEAKMGRLDPVIGRSKEILRVSQILTRRRKNNPLLIGEPGVGKTAIAEGLAQSIFKEEVNPKLIGTRLIQLSMSTLVAGTRFRGEFEERIQDLIQELKDNPEVLVFIDEIHTIMGAGSGGGSLDASNILKPELARGEIRLIGATTFDEYRENLESDGAFTRRFQNIHVYEPTDSEVLQILERIEPIYSQFHNIKLDDGILEHIVNSSNRYLNNRFQPDKSIDILDEVGSKMFNGVSMPSTLKNLVLELERINEFKGQALKDKDYQAAAQCRDDEKEIKDKIKNIKEKWSNDLKEKPLKVSIDDVNETISQITNVPIDKLNKSEASVLLDLENTMLDSVIGQNDAIKAVTAAVRRNKFGTRDPNKPIGTFLFVGPTGVGKTETAKTLAETVFGHNSLIRIDMSEYTASFNVSKLIGSPPGYVGYEQGGQLTEKVKDNPYSVVLFDEIEKAHPLIFNTLLQLLDEGRLTDGLGKTIDFTNTVIIMTSNIGVKELEDFGSGIGFNRQNQANSLESKKAFLLKEMKKSFKPEFLNRISDIVFYKPLSTDDTFKITRIQCQNLLQRFADQGYFITIEDSAIKYIVDNHYSESWGARPIQRGIIKDIETPLVDKLLAKRVKDGDGLQYNIKISYKDDALSFKITKKKS